MARVTPWFGSVASIHRLRLCSSQDSYRSHTPGEFGASAKQLDSILAPSENSDNAFRTLRIVGFTWYFNDGSDEVLREHYAKSSAWVQRMLPRLQE